MTFLCCLQLLLRTVCVPLNLFIVEIDSHHGFPKVTAHIRQHRWVTVMTCTIALALLAGSPLLKIPDPTNTPSHPSCIISAASAGVATPPAANCTTGSLPSCFIVRRRYLLGVVEHLVVVHVPQNPNISRQRPHVADGLDDVAGSSLSLGANHRRSLANTAQCLAEVAASADEGDAEVVLVDVVGLVGGSENLRLIDVIDTNSLKDLRLDKVTNTSFRHDRNSDRLLNLLDELGVRHASNAALSADVGRDTLESHDGASAGLLSDTSLIGGHDIHDNAAAKHLSEADLDGEGRLLGVGLGDGAVSVESDDSGVGHFRRRFGRRNRNPNPRWI
ncbi:LOW QUALITY PROTEIN: hypothetical protein V2J09_006980 [Rumex salicifolius]